LTVILLVVGSIMYFATDVAERNNEMMYENIYGENATYPKAVYDLQKICKRCKRCKIYHRNRSVVQDDAKRDLL